MTGEHMKLIVGLGNPGVDYNHTRHNVGFTVVDHLAAEFGPQVIKWEQDNKMNVLTIRFGEVMLVKPLTFMNKSGYAVRALMDYYKLTPADVWVIHDDIDLPLGKLKIREHGGSAGHNGINSIIEQLKTDEFVRFRLGIGKGVDAIAVGQDKNMHHRSVISYVLSKFQPTEAGTFKHLIKKGTEAVQFALEKGIDRAMNKYNS